MWRILKDSEIIRGQTRPACFQQIGINDCVYQAGIHLSYFQTQLLNLKSTCKVFEPIEFGQQSSRIALSNDSVFNDLKPTNFH